MTSGWPPIAAPSMTVSSVDGNRRLAASRGARGTKRRMHPLDGEAGVDVEAEAADVCADVRRRRQRILGDAVVRELDLPLDVVEQPSADVAAPSKLTRSPNLVAPASARERPPTTVSELAVPDSRKRSVGRTMRPPMAAAFPLKMKRRLKSIASDPLNIFWQAIGFSASTPQTGTRQASVRPQRHRGRSECNASHRPLSTRAATAAAAFQAAGAAARPDSNAPP